MADEAGDILLRGLADGLIVSGSGTGKSTDPAHVEAAQSAARAAGNSPVFVGSGVTADTIGAFLPHADGFIVGTAFKPNGDPRQPVDVNRVRALLAALTSPGF
jgi:predicted TIM-barrel enzyme